MAAHFSQDARPGCGGCQFLSMHKVVVEIPGSSHSQNAKAACTDQSRRLAAFIAMAASSEGNLIADRKRDLFLRSKRAWEHAFAQIS
jgi:hypothetical protein